MALTSEEALAFNLQKCLGLVFKNYKLKFYSFAIYNNFPKLCPNFFPDHADTNIKLNDSRLYNSPMGTIVDFTYWQMQNIVLAI